ncbi:helix-loop-helix DNA-binding domain-containing protein [Mycena leptocephala]|nr:helix-loop-helix DNA-binding domain-containing protein [Mycena leptocephala]
MNAPQLEQNQNRSPSENCSGAVLDYYHLHAMDRWFGANGWAFFHSSLLIFGHEAFCITLYITGRSGHPALHSSHTLSQGPFQLMSTDGGGQVHGELWGESDGTCKSEMKVNAEEIPNGEDEIFGTGRGQSPEKESQCSPKDEKRHRLRESHNAVERRRRENINRWIKELATLIPEYLLEADGHVPEPKKRGQQAVILQKSMEYIKSLEQQVTAQVAHRQELEEQLRTSCRVGLNSERPDDVPLGIRHGPTTD